MSHGVSRFHLAALTAVALLSLSEGKPAPGQALTDVARHTTTDAEWRDRAGRHLSEREYRVSRSARGLQAPNRAHALRTYFTSTGIRVHERSAESAELLALHLAAVGRGSDLAPVAPGVVTSEGARVEIERPELVEWYENSAEGLEHGFTLTRRPAGGRELVLELAVEGAEASLRGDSVLFTTTGGRRLEYGQLYAIDATGRSLPSRFADVSHRRLRVSVDDGGAVYPVVIDPLLTKAPDTQLESGQDYAHLAYSVAGAGDVNADGYDDVVVGAPLYDSGDADAGAAFVFFGSAAGIADGDPTNASGVLVSDQAHASFGVSVASAGDVNDDGFNDVIVGSPSYDAGQVDEGAVFIFHGSSSGIASATAAEAATRFESDEPSGWLGSSVAGAGDVNGDGYGDVIIGQSGSFNSAAFVFHGGIAAIASGNPASAATRLESAGAAVAGAGDVNGDGYDDVIVGDRNHSGSQTQEGGAFLFHGSPAGIADATPQTAATRLVSLEPAALFGTSVAGAGDVNGDGYDDVIVGAPRWAPALPPDDLQPGGAAFVFLGAPAGVADGDSATAAARLESERWLFASHMGASVSGAGDVDGDGYDDVIVGAPFHHGAWSQYGTGGAAFIFRGGAGGVASASSSGAAIRLLGSTANQRLGWGVAGAGDVNGDGHADVLVGDPSAVRESESGIAYLFHGGDMIGQTLLESDQPEAYFGSSAAGAGDLNADGYADVIIGAPLYDAPLTDEGAAFVFLGGSAGIGAGGPAAAAAQLESNQKYARFGESVAGAGDVDGDGYDDVIVGTSAYESVVGTARESTALFVFTGGPSGIGDGSPETAATLLTFDRTVFSQSVQVGAAGDVNGDDFGDVFAVVSGVDAEDRFEALFLFHGSSAGIASGTFATAASVIEIPYSFAIRVARAGDVNGDGYGDVILGVPDHAGAFVFHGSPVGIASGGVENAATVLVGDDAETWFGASAAGAGDVNGDGYDDVIVGAPYLFDEEEGNPAEPRSAAFVFHGSAAGVAAGGPEDAATRLGSDQLNSSMGYSVASAGDFDGDGYDEVIVGAPGAAYGGIANAGAAFVFRGSATGVASGGPATAVKTIVIGEPDGWLGANLAGVGDVNGDGYADVIVAQRDSDAPDPNEGVVLVVLPEPRGTLPIAGGAAFALALLRRRRKASRCEVSRGAV